MKIKKRYEFYIDGRRYVEDKLKNLLIQEVTYIEKNYATKFKEILVKRFPRYLSIDGSGMYSPKLALNYYVETNHNTEQTFKLMRKLADAIGLDMHIPNEYAILFHIRKAKELRCKLRKSDEHIDS